jgi:CHASE2 domain-containing sensor protein
MGLSGLAYIVQGFVLGSEGFSGTNTVPQLLAYLLVFAWSIWLLIIAWRMKESVEAFAGPG